MKRKHSNIAIFVPHAGCPYRCAFCDQRAITSQQALPHAADVERICTQAMQEIPDTSETEIAFFGGSFTAIPQAYMCELLQAAQPFLKRCKGIRISTRPDCIHADVLHLLKEYGVTAIELGAQSMDDAVLSANDRGHTAADVYRASELIQMHGFELGLQVMIGLYKSTEETEQQTFRQVIAIHPDTVRLYPVVILKGTRLAELFLSGTYVPMPFDRIVDITADALLQCMAEGIRVIKCGLHASEAVAQDRVGGYYHPAFRELCEGRIYRRQMEMQMDGSRRYTFAVTPSHISKAVGHRRETIACFEKKGITVKIIGDEEVPAFRCKCIEKET